MDLQTRKSRLALCLTALAVLLAVGSLAGCGGGASGSAGAEIETGPLRVSGRGIAPYREPSGDNSIEEYGHEASRAELEQAAKTVHEYLVARVSKDWDRACALSTPYLRHHIKVIYELTPPHTARTCGQMLKALAPGEPPIADTTREATEVDADSLRVEGGTGFLFFDAKTEGRKLIMGLDGNTWKPAGLLPTPLH
jgi:hypothetical protein